MFEDYKVINKNNEKALVLYVDFNTEFGLDNLLHHKYSSMKKEIKKIIKKINFNGEKVAISMGGLVLATMLIVKNPTTNKLNLYVDNNVVPKTEIIKVEKEIKNEKNEVIENKEIKKIDIDNKMVSSIETSKKEELITDNNVEEKQNIETKINKQMVTIYRNNGSVITLDLDEYLIGVVAAEVPAEFNIEALKTQAIISRTYTLRSMKIGRKLTDTVSTQVYKDNDELKNIWGDSYDKYYNKIKLAVEETKDLAIYYNDEYIDALFFSTSNGKTEDAKYVWGNSIPYLKSVDSSWDIDTTPYLRTTTKDLENVLNILGVSDSNFNIISRDESDRVLEITVDNKTYTGVEFRNLLGLRSADFDLEVIDNTLKITTRGYGHGVGLSQYGANKMANNGKNYEEIIKYYYTGVEIK